MKGRPVRAAGLAAAGARLAYCALRRWPPSGAATWTRTNHRGEPVTLLEGPAVAAGAVTAALLAARPDGQRGTPGPANLGSPGGRQAAALAVAGAGAAAFGIYDDLAGSGARRGLRGHLGALARGQVTSGAVKIGGIGASGVAAAALLGGSAADQVINAGLIAGGANLLNLFDLRPGRAIKVALTASALLAAGSATARQCAAAPAGAALALLPDDLGERAMLGDAGANAIGAMLGAAAAAALPRPARIGGLAVIVGLTAASEVVSFTKVIERTPALRWIDMLGRRPVAVATPASPAGVTRATGAADGTIADGAIADGEPERAGDPDGQHGRACRGPGPVTAAPR